MEVTQCGEKMGVDMSSSVSKFLAWIVMLKSRVRCKLLNGLHGRHGSSLQPVADVNVAIRKIATLLKPDKDIVHDGDHIIIKTLSTFKNYNMDFHVGKEFEEDLSGVDDRKCMVSIEKKNHNFLKYRNIKT